MAFCTSCGSAVTGKFCAACGSAVASETPAEVASAETRQIVIQERQPKTPPPYREQSLANLTIRTGESCPYCSSTLYSKHYTFWHVIVCVLGFPIGLLVLLAPVKRCENYHSYGVGTWIIGWLQVATILVAITIGIIAWSLSSKMRAGNQQPSLATSGVGDSGTTQPQGNAVDVVREYYADWNRADYSSMYPLLSSAFQSTHPYSDYAKAHAYVPEISVDAEQTADPSVVSVHIVSSDRDSNGSISKNTLNGTWSLVSENGSWKLDSEDVR